MFWRRLVGLEEQTASEKRAALNGVSLFFGALIGANLGATERMPLSDYVLLVAVICLIVLYIHLAPVARKRWRILAHLAVLLGGLYVLLIHDAGAAAFDGARPSPHIFATICSWLVSVAVVEFRPVSKHSRGAASTDPTS
jgi:4-hydroxybenzoate polyprenyltransferase